MGIKEDAGKLVLLYHKRKTKGEKQPDINDLFEVTKWEASQIENALDYAERKGFLKSIKTMGNNKGVQNRASIELTEEGVDLIEETNTQEGRNEFNVTFNFNMNNEFNIDSIIKGEAKLF